MASRTTTDPIEILLEMGVDLDNLSEEEDYLSALIEAIATIQFQTKGAGDERSAILQKEVVKIRKQRKASAFKVRKTKISAEAFKKGTASDSSTKESQAALPTAAIIPFRNPKINLDPVETEEPEVEKEKEKEEVKDKSKNYLKDILKSVTNIADILKQQYSLKKKTADFDRKKSERERRDLQKENLAKRFEGLKNVAQKIIAPVSSIFDKIFGFLFNILLGKFLMKLVDWFADPKNQSKIKSIIRFLTDNWPKLLSAYLIFGTGIGKFARFLVKILAKGAVRLAAATAGLIAKLFGSRKLGKFSRFLGKRGGLISGGIQAVATIAGFKALESAFTQELGGEESASIDRDIPAQPVEGFKGGGVVQPIQKFANGGLAKPVENFIVAGNNTFNLSDAKQSSQNFVDNNISQNFIGNNNTSNNSYVNKYRGGDLVQSGQNFIGDNNTSNNSYVNAYQGGGLVQNNTSNKSYVNAYQGGDLVQSGQKFISGDNNTSNNSYVNKYQGGDLVQSGQKFISGDNNTSNNSYVNKYKGGDLVQNNTNNASVSAYQGGGLVKNNTNNTFTNAYQGGGLVKNISNAFISAYQGGGLVKSIQKFVNGGLVKPTYKYAGGGGVNVNLITPTNNIFGYSGGGSPAVSVDGGEVEGPGGIDKVPAMLTAGEFVMSRGAVQKYGLQELESMNASGGGTNKPKMVEGAYYAAGGGLIGDREQSDKELKPNKKPKTKDNKKGFFGKIGSGLKSLFGIGSASPSSESSSGKGQSIPTQTISPTIPSPTFKPNILPASVTATMPGSTFTPPKPLGDSESGSAPSVGSISNTQKEALAVLAKYESGAAGYDAVNQIGTNDGRGVLGFSGDIKKMDQYNGRSLTDFTIKEIKDLQYDNGSLSNQQWINSGKLHAVGRYQFIGNTLPGVAERAGIPDDAKFTSEVQDLLALQLMKERGISPWVGPSDKATAAERAIVESARTEKLPEVTGGEQEQMQIAAQQQEQLSVPPSPQDTPYIKTSARMGRVSSSNQNISGKTMDAAVTPFTPAFATIPAVSTTPVTTENITKLMSSSQSVMSEKTSVAPTTPKQSTPTESLISSPSAEVQKPSIIEIQNMDIRTLNSFLDPGKTGASFPLVFAAAKAAKEKARAEGLPENEVQRLGQVAAVIAKLYGDTTNKSTSSIFNLNIPRMDVSGMKNSFQTTYNNSNSTQLQETQSKSSSLMNTLLGGDSTSSLMNTLLGGDSTSSLMNTLLSDNTSSLMNTLIGGDKTQSSTSSSLISTLMNTLLSDKTSTLMNTLVGGDKTQSSTSSSLMNTLMGDQYYSSTTGKYYKNYTEALKDPEVKASAQLEETKKKLSLAPSQAPKVTVPSPPPTGPNGGPRVTVIKSGKKGKSPTLSGSGSETPYINPGNGNKSKFNILGIPVPFF